MSYRLLTQQEKAINRQRTTYPQYAKLLPMVHERYVKLNIGLNVPETEFAA